MAVSISLTPAPGLFVGQTSATVSMTASGYGTILASTTSQPTFAKNIAYDEFGNPFLSVVQDGKGNVFFDGGFPKYYNNTWSPTYTTFGAMTNQLKLLYNAMKWCAEGNVSANNKILLFGDAVAGEPYAVKDTGPNGFATSITNVGALAGFTVTIRDLSDYPVTSDIPLSYLQQFSSVIFLSSSVTNWDTAAPRLSANSRANIATYRQQGGGVMIITDHNVFQTLANQVATLFGCSFSGNVDRNPVSVDTLVATYGMHPLWANMTGSVYAGASEGIVTIPVNTPFNPATQTISLSGTGYKTIYLTVSDPAGAVTTYAYSYALNVPDPVTLTLPATTSYKYLDLPVEVDRLNSTNTTGNMSVGGQVIGTFSRLATGLTNKTYTVSTPKPVVTTNGESVEVDIGVAVPVTYHKVYPVLLQKVDVTSYKPAKRVASMRKNELAAIGPIGRMMSKLRADQGVTFSVVPSEAMRMVNNYYSVSYRTSTERVITAGASTPASGPVLTDYGYVSNTTTNFGSVDSQSPIFGNQILTRASCLTRRVGGARQWSMSFKRTDNAVQVSSNFTGRRVRVVDAQGNIVLDQPMSAATGSTVDIGADTTTNLWTFIWTLPNTFIFDAGGAWKVQIL